MSSLKRKFFYAVQIALFSLGLLFIGIGILGSFNWKEIPLNIGITFIATSLISLFNKFFLMDSGSKEIKQKTIIDETKTEIGKWGLVKIYKYRNEKNEKINSYIKESAKEIDVMTQNSLFTLRNKIGRELRDRLTNVLKMRILIPKANLLSEDIKNLIEWCKKLDNDQQDNIKIRSYEGTPQDLYFRVDDMIFIGPYRINVHSNHETITYEFTKNSEGGKIYSEYFEQIWSAGTKIL
jgi:hypothetical protein